MKKSQGGGGGGGGKKLTSMLTYLVNFSLVQTLCMRAASALRAYTGSSEPLLVAYTISTTIPYYSPYQLSFLAYDALS